MFSMPKVRGVYEHPPDSGVWWIQYFDHGRRRRERVGRKSDAITLYRKRKTEILSGEKLPELRRRKVTFGELMDDAQRFSEAHHRSPRDIIGKVELAKPDLGSYHADAVTPEILSAWIERRKVSPGTFNRYKAFFSLCFREGMRSGKVHDNPAKLIRRRREPSGRKRYLSREEYTAVMKAIGADQPLRQLAFCMSVHTGMRLSEQFSLSWRQVDLDRNEIHLTRTKNGDDRTIPIVSVLAKTLTDLRREIQGKKTALAFPRPRGGKGAVQPRWFHDALVEAEIDDYTWHNNRHTFCSWLAINGTPLKTIQELAGHKTISITARYAHLCPDHKKAELERMVIGPKTAEVVEITSGTARTA